MRDETHLEVTALTSVVGVGGEVKMKDLNDNVRMSLTHITLRRGYLETSLVRLDKFLTLDELSEGRLLGTYED